MELSRNKQIQLRRLLKQKRNVDRFKARRTYEGLALELGVCDITVRNVAINNPNWSVLSPAQMAYVKLMRSEYDKHRGDFPSYSYQGIADQVGCSKRTVERWSLMMYRGEI